MNQSSPNENEEEGLGTDDGGSGLLGRRAYLRLTGGAVAAVATASAGVGGAAAASAETISVSAGEHRRIDLQGGDTLENTIIDVSASGASVELRARTSGGDITVRNVAIKGENTTNDNAAVRLAAFDANSRITLEHCYFGDGDISGPNKDDWTGVPCVFVNADHAGDLLVRNVNITGWRTGLYASPPGNPPIESKPNKQVGEGGTVRVESSYMEAVRLSGWKLGTDGSYVENTATKNVGHPIYGVWERTVARNCDVYNPSDEAFNVGYKLAPQGEDAVVVARDCRAKADRISTGPGTFRGTVGSNPDVTPPAGVPMSPEEAVQGSRLPNHVRIHGTGSLTQYRFSVSGDLEAGSDFDTDGTDEISGSSASGQINTTGDDDYYFDGRITDFERDGDLEVYVNGEQVNPDSFLPREIRVHGTGELTNYRFEVDGDLAPGPDFDTDGTDEISGSSARGRVNGTGDDDFYFSGRVTAFERDGPLEVYVDGQQVNPDSFLPHELRISNEGYDEPATYRFAVTEELAATGSVNPNDDLSGTSADGQVNSGSDAYRFAGDLVFFEHDGPVDLYLDGQQVDPDRFARLENHLRVHGVGELSQYRFEVSGDLEAGPDFDTDGTDGISGSQGEGQVNGTGDDDFYFDGDLVSFERDGPLELYLNGQQVNPDEFDRPANHLRIHGAGELATYEFTVSGALEAGPEFDTDGTDAISGSSASGQINTTGDDDFYFDGDVERFAHDGPLELYVNGEQVNPDSLGRDHVLSIVGQGPRVGYEFSVSGALEKSTARNGSINDGDTISGGTATGFVFGGTDSYAFTGELIDFAVESTEHVAVYLDGERVDPGRLSYPRTITISNRGFSEPATYQFTVSGGLQATDSVNPNDEISGSSAQGQVNGGSDTYRFSGEVTAFDNDGPVEVLLDGETVQSSR